MVYGDPIYNYVLKTKNHFGLVERPWSTKRRGISSLNMGHQLSLVRATGSCLSKLVGNREDTLHTKRGNALVYGKPVDREFEPHLKHQTGWSQVRILNAPPVITHEGQMSKELHLDLRRILVLYKVSQQCATTEQFSIMLRRVHTRKFDDKNGKVVKWFKTPACKVGIS